MTDTDRTSELEQRVRELEAAMRWLQWEARLAMRYRNGCLEAHAVLEHVTDALEAAGGEG